MTALRNATPQWILPLALLSPKAAFAIDESSVLESAAAYEFPDYGKIFQETGFDVFQ